MVRFFYIQGHYVNEGQQVWTGRSVPYLSFPTLISSLARTAAGLQAQPLLYGASGITAKGQTLVDIFDVKPQLTAPAESEVLRE